LTPPLPVLTKLPLPWLVDSVFIFYYYIFRNNFLRIAKMPRLQLNITCGCPICHPHGTALGYGVIKLPWDNVTKISVMCCWIFVNVEISFINFK
jgi:hypothetical protein